MPVSADAEAVLNRLAKQFGFYWTVCDGIFYAVNRDPVKGTMQKNVEVKSPYLINVDTVLNGTRRYQQGVMCSCTFNPGILPGHSVEINSEIEPRANAKWRVHKVTHDLSCHSPQSFVTRFHGIGRRKG